MTPHPQRFARALALLSGFAACGCYRAHERVEPSAGDGATPDAVVADAGPVDCRALSCTCPTLVAEGTCDARFVACCPVVGPLAPPDLPRD